MFCDFDWGIVVGMRSIVVVVEQAVVVLGSMWCNSKGAGQRTM